MTIGTLVIIVLAIVVLATLSFGFYSGWSNLWGRISPTKVNVDSIKTACQTACITQQQYAYCCLERRIVTEKGAVPTPGTCFSEKAKLLKGDCSMECDSYIKSACPLAPKKIIDPAQTETP